ncbi:DUF6797 domain-containing protein [Pareuzebyella sediminis]|uniref:DUF6797 domain-containing protein n=1 Tax=Pareuzebyella sediminis TaxID=2607998 RepID=UPI0011ECB589|nr:DUF6797 domain-containing protein [Pareuzebyella sediminis]
MMHLVLLLCLGCQQIDKKETWRYEVDLGNEMATGNLKFEKDGGSYQGTLLSFQWGTIDLGEVIFDKDSLNATFKLFGKKAFLQGKISEPNLKGLLVIGDQKHPFTAVSQSTLSTKIDRSSLNYVLSDKDLPDSESNIDHAGIIAREDREALKRGERIYSSNCVNCHGTQEVEGSIPASLKFWEQPFKAGNDAYSMYQTITKGYGMMPPQPQLTPQEKYDVITYIRENYVRKNPTVELVENSPGYLAGLPKGTSQGPETKPYQPWADMDYGNFLINTYELADEKTGIPRYHSPGPSPYPDENYLKNNFAYKGIAIRLDNGEGGISKGKAWMIFDHDLMRVAGGWTGKGFIDWNGILLNDKHETYPRTIGELHFETPVGPGWANPSSGSFEDPRFRARDGRAFGPLPKSWANYKGLYHFENHMILSYTVGRSSILEELGLTMVKDQPIFIRTLNIDPSTSKLKMRVAPLSKKVALKGDGAHLEKEDGFHMLIVDSSKTSRIKLFIANDTFDHLSDAIDSQNDPEDLRKYTTTGGVPHYPEKLKSTITIGTDTGPFAVDQLTPPFDNPWASRMKLSGIDFLENPDEAVLCTTDGDVWMVKGLMNNTGALTWQRIGSGLFQPLGIKVVENNIYVICRDQLVRLHDFNGDKETDFYESFNHDHQVTDHFHEFAMGLQADKAGNLYYAKSGRHAREALVPQHGTLLKVSKDGSTTEIIAKGFRAANGVCINPDGSFFVTDQQGFWNPMNRINWVKGKGKFYGNMWGYNPPKDSTATGMQPPLAWVDMEFDRSPSELVWVKSEKWGPLNGALLSLSYGYGKIQLVLHEKIGNTMQGGVIDLPGIKFLTGVMRGRFNPADGQLYACGMSAWGTNQMLRGGGFYRIRYTGKPLTVPTSLEITPETVTLKFAPKINASAVRDLSNFEIKTWRLIRSSAYGSDRYDIKKLKISKATLTSDGHLLSLRIQDLQPTDVMTIKYSLLDHQGNPITGTLQNTIHTLGNR